MKRALVDTVALNTRSKRPRLHPPLNIKRRFTKLWISATKTHNYLLNNTLCDWLDLYGKNERQFPSSKFHESNESFIDFLMRKGVEFEDELIHFLGKSHRVITVSKYYNIDKVQDTLKYMKQGVPLIHSAPIFNKKNKTYGIVDLLVRSDYFCNVFNDSPISGIDKNICAPNLGADTPYHYRVIDIKFSSLHLTSDGTHLLNSGRMPAYKAQLCVYNDALASLQGYKPSCAYIMGRRWSYTTKGNNYYGTSCIDRLGVVNFEDRDEKYVDLTEKAINWFRDVSKNGVHWKLNPPTRKELYPNMNVDSPHWFKVKEELANDIGEITMLWQCGIRNRDTAMKNGVNNWKDRNCNSKILGVGKSYSPVVDKLIEINRDSNEKILPRVVENNIGDWKNSGNELFVDFETFSDICRSFNDLPHQKSFHMIFMIGAGYFENGEWHYRSFICRDNTIDEEYRIMDEFTQFVIERGDPKLFYWHAENNFWKKSSDIQFERFLYTERKRNNIIFNWNLEENWVDMATIFRKEPIVIKDCFSYGLKAISKSMRNHGMITTKMESECCSGMMAMVKAWNCYKSHSNPADAPVMKDIETYNEFDCKVMWDMITYLRRNHI